MSEAEQQWHLIDGNGQQCGPYTWEQLQGFAGNGTISPATQVWRVGMESWVCASEAEESIASRPDRPRLLTGATTPPARPAESTGTTGPLADPAETQVQAPRSNFGRKVLVAFGAAASLLLVALFLESNKGSVPQKSAEGSRKSENVDSKVEEAVPTKEDWTKILGEAIDEKKLMLREINGKRLMCVVGSEDPFTGWSKAMHENGQPELVIRYEAGAADGPLVCWHPNGRKAEERFFKDNRGTGVWTKWYENGQMMEKVAYEDGKRDGPCTFWYENGQKKEEGRYKEERRDGPWSGWKVYGGIDYERNYENPFSPDQATEAEKASLAALKTLGASIEYEPAFMVKCRFDELSDDDLIHFENLPRLEELILEETSLTDNGLAHLKNLTRLQSLTLWSASGITDAGLFPLRELPNLSALVLEGTQVTNAGLRLIADFPKLRHLELEGSKINNAGLVHLKEMPHLSSLHLQSNEGITNAGLKHVGACPELRSLRVAGMFGLGTMARGPLGFVTGKHPSDAGLGNLAGMEELNSLSLQFIELTDAGLELLKSYPKLEYIEFLEKTASNAGLVHLVELPQLKGLKIRSTRITDDGVPHLKRLSGLRWLDISGTKISNAEAKELQAALPKCLIKEPSALNQRKVYMED